MATFIVLQRGSVLQMKQTLLKSFLVTFVFLVGKPGCNSGVASYFRPGLVSGSIVSLPFVTLTSPKMNLSSECGCPHEPCDLDVCTGSL